MNEYYNDNTAISLELFVLSGGTTVTGKTPVALIRDKDSGNYFDFASRTFTSTTTSATAVLTSAIDGVYRYSWDISGLFFSNSGTHLTIEYHDATALSLEDILITDRMRVDVAGGGGNTVIKGIWNSTEKKKLFDKLKDIKNDIKDGEKKLMFLLQRILTKKTLRKEDIEFIKDIQERDGDMWQEFLKIMKLQENATSKDLIDALEEYYKAENEASREVKDRLKKLTEDLKPKKNNEWEEEEDD